MSVAELRKYTFVSKYAQFKKDKQRRETWHEAVERVRRMMLDVYPQVEDEINYAYDLMERKYCLGSQRVLQFAGPSVLKHHMRAYNCTSSYIDRLRFFQEAFYILLCGAGAGYSVQKHHVAKLPPLIAKGRTYSKSFIIEDTIEGWADSVGVLLSSYFENDLFPEYLGRRVDFDFSKIRPAGSEISSGIGKAPGPEPLQRALLKIQDFLDSIIGNQTQLRPIQAYDITCFLSDAVLSGGVRRSSTIALFSPDDEEMIYAKTGDWFYKNRQRARSNNSAMLLRKETSFEDFNRILQAGRQNGDPGFVFTDSLEYVLNPCAEINMYPQLLTGESGWQCCNLSTGNGSKVKSKEDFLDISRACAIFGTLQAGFTDFPYLGTATEEITRREALLGVSFTGWMENPDIMLDPEVQQEGAKLAVKVNEELAKKININPAARVTACKPDGSTSCLLGTSSGIHPHHAKRYFRRVQANVLEPPAQHFMKINPQAVELSEWGESGTDLVLNFCVEVDSMAKTKNDVSALELLKIVKLTQNNWVKYGKILDRCSQPGLMHSVSNTIHIKDDEWEDVGTYIYKNRDSFTAISFIANSGDKDFVQAPFTAVYTPHQILKEYGEGGLFASGLIESGLKVSNNKLWDACNMVLGLLDYNVEQNLWVVRVKKFADKYLEGDLRKTTYLLKDVYNWKLWTDLKREYQAVNYEECIETEDNTKLEQNVACAGGACEI